MRWEMEVLSSYLSSASWLIDESRSTRWTQSENKIFENALAVYDKDTPDRWQKVAAMLPGKTVGDVIKQYKELEDDISNIEAGLVPIPGYDTTSAFTLEWVNHHGYDDGYSPGCGGAKRGPPGARPADHERKKGVPWTEEEHKLFLLGLKKYGKGDWRNISRNFVVTRTPTQVASHAQKYFIRQLSGGKDKRRASIHDITTVNLENEALSSPDNNNNNNNNNNKRCNSPDHSTITVQTQQQASSITMPKTHFQWDQSSNETVIPGFDSMQGSLFMAPCYGAGTYDLKVQGQNLQRSSDFLENYVGAQNLGFQIQPPQQYPHG